MREAQSRGGHALFAISVAAAILLGSSIARHDEAASDALTGSARLLSIQPGPDASAMCQWEPVTQRASLTEEHNLFRLLGPASLFAASQQAAGTIEVSRPPIRHVRDTAPSYTAIAVDSRSDEVFLQDVNSWAIRVFNRLDNTPPGAALTEPKRVIMGGKTRMQYNSDIYIDPKNGEVYSIENDTGDSFGVFAPGVDGDVEPLRKLKVPHRAFAMAVDEEKQEMYVSVQSVSQVAVFRKGASGDEKPLRVLKGPLTRLEAAHGIAIDVQGKRMFVNNWGAASDYNVLGRSRFNLPSITVYPLGAEGDVPPQRVIQGPRTELNWPGAMFFDPERGELYVANAMGQSILVFNAAAEGDAAPLRVLKGPKTGLSYPVDLAVDLKNKELWAVNFGNASATVYSLTAAGDEAPLRTIRSAPRGKRGLKFGKVSTVAYDSKRDELLVPN